MAACTSACGYCGRCSEPWEHWIDSEAFPTCDECLRPITVGPVSLAGVGIFCSRKCADKGAAKHEAVMTGRHG